MPRTRSGNVLEVPVKRTLMGEAADLVLPRDSLANPAALHVFTELATNRSSDATASILASRQTHSDSAAVSLRLTNG